MGVWRNLYPIDMTIYKRQYQQIDRTHAHPKLLYIHCIEKREAYWGNGGRGWEVLETVGAMSLIGRDDVAF